MCNSALNFFLYCLVGRKYDLSLYCFCSSPAYVPTPSSAPTTVSANAPGLDPVPVYTSASFMLMFFSYSCSAPAPDSPPAPAPACALAPSPAPAPAPAPVPAPDLLLVQLLLMIHRYPQVPYRTSFLPLPLLAGQGGPGSALQIEQKQVRNPCVYSRPSDRVWP